jgi:uncharacterized protein (DUF1330 family)
VLSLDQIPTGQENTMQRYLALSFAMLAGAAIGATAVSQLAAQTKAPTAYAVIDISSIDNADLFKTLLSKSEAPVVGGGGKFVIRTDKITATDGTPPARFVVIAFDNMEKAKAWEALPAQKEIDDMRHKSAKARLFLVDGVAN